MTTQPANRRLVTEATLFAWAGGSSASAPFSVTRDSAGRIATVTDTASGVVTTVTRDASDRLSGYTTSDGATRTITRNAAQQIASVS